MLNEPHVNPPTPVQGAPSVLREAVVQTINADGTVDLKATDSRTGWTHMTVPGWYAPTVGDHVVVADLQGDPQKARIVAPLTGSPAATTASVAAAQAAAVAAQTSANQAAPTGVVQALALSTAPTGWQLCDGSDAATTALDTALKASGSPYGLNGGTGKAKVPNLNGRHPLGVGTATGVPGATAHTLGQTGGEETHTLTLAEAPAHAHGARTAGQGLVQGGGTTANVTVGGGNFAHDSSATQTDSKGGGGSHNNLSPYVGLNFIIKT